MTDIELLELDINTGNYLNACKWMSNVEYNY